MPASQHEDCIFCKIARGDIPCTSVFEFEELIAFLDISPVNKGHTLLVPKAHMETLFDMPAGIGEMLFAAMKQVGSAVMKATGAEGLNVVQNNYSAAGQQVPHVHWHLIPRFADEVIRRGRREHIKICRRWRPLLMPSGKNYNRRFQG